MPPLIKERTLLKLSQVYCSKSEKHKALKFIQKLKQEKNNSAEHELLFLIHSFLSAHEIDDRYSFKKRYINIILLELTNELLAALLTINLTASAIHLLMGNTPPIPGFLLCLLLDCIQNNLQTSVDRGKGFDLMRAFSEIPEQFIDFSGACTVTLRAIENSKQFVSSTFGFFMGKLVKAQGHHGVSPDTSYDTCPKT